MNVYETTIQNELEALQTEPEQGLRDKVLRSAAAGTAAPLPFRRRFRGKTLLIATVLMATLTVTAFAYGGTIKQFFFGDSSAAQIDESTLPFDVVERYEYDDGSSGVILHMGHWEIVNRSVPELPELTELETNDMMENGLGMFTASFDSFEEFYQAAPFTVKEPAYLPDGLEFFKGMIYLHKDGSYSYDAWIHYSHYAPGGGYKSIQLVQLYVGPDAYLDVQTVAGIEKVMVGDIEALATAYMAENTYTVNNMDVAVKFIDLIWIKDDVLYRLYGTQSNNDPYDLETLIAIAESV
ncbi:MAG: DUF4367 domain-containing protein [Oscillospiraceae bacterium]|jgi:hypothetical protein|nr:DUF4367 domain-containing protein [Oscillospiraceae bacterium]